MAEEDGVTDDEVLTGAVGVTVVGVMAAGGTTDVGVRTAGGATDVGLLLGGTPAGLPIPLRI